MQEPLGTPDREEAGWSLRVIAVCAVGVAFFFAFMNAADCQKTQYIEDTRQMELKQRAQPTEDK